MSFLFGAPHRYHQGPGLLDQLGPILRGIGAHPVVVLDAGLQGMLQARVTASLGGRGQILPFGGEITYPAIDRLVAQLAGAAPDCVAGIGGGKALDAAKAVALKLRLPVVTVPTIASNDSPTSAAIAIYDDDHTMIAVDRLHRSPEAVIVDTALIAAAPVHFLLAGIGDALSKKFEADGCFAGTGLTPFGTRPGRTGVAIADACYRTLRAHGVAGVAAARRGVLTDDLDAVIEATVLMSGLGFENGGLSLAHSLTRGLVRVRGARDAAHGAQIAVALCVQLCAEGRADDMVLDVMGFCRQLGLPVCLADLGMPDPTGAEVDAIARWTMTAPHLANLAVPVDSAAIAAAIHRAEGLAHQGGRHV